MVRMTMWVLAALCVPSALLAQAPTFRLTGHDVEVVGELGGWALSVEVERREFGSDDGNRLTYAASDALNAVATTAAVREEDSRIHASMRFFPERHRPVGRLLRLERVGR